MKIMEFIFVASLLLFTIGETGAQHHYRHPRFPPRYGVGGPLPPMPPHSPSHRGKPPVSMKPPPPVSNHQVHSPPPPPPPPPPPYSFSRSPPVIGHPQPVLSPPHSPYKKSPPPLAKHKVHMSSPPPTLTHQPPPVVCPPDEGMPRRGRHVHLHFTPPPPPGKAPPNIH